MKKIVFCLSFALLVAISSMAQNVLWTGAVDTDFFNEANWVIDGTQNAPSAGAIDENTPIDLNLIVNGKKLTLPTNITLAFTTGKGLTLIKASIEFESLTSGYIKLTDNATLILRSASPLGTEATLRLEDAYSWIKLLKVGATDAASLYLNKITSKGNSVTTDVDILINQYYYKGSLLRLKDAAVTALTLYDGAGQTGESFKISPQQIYSRTQLGAFENKSSSFRLERGYQVVVSIYQDGTGKSETYIASEEPLLLDLPAALNNTVSFVRVMPWNWVTKKGASKFQEVGNTWTYNWGNTGKSLAEMEYAPMSWGYGGASLASVANYIKMEKVTHVLGFNESDNCNDQSGQYNDLCQISVAVPQFKNLMLTGLRLASPSPREEGPFGWLKNFRDAAVQADVRYDVLGVHWYDWGGNPVNTPFEDPVKIFNRFKSYLDRVYAEHKMPIWITEFNANANRDASVHKAFLELALPYLESLSFVERYDFFQPMPSNAGNRTDIAYAVFYDANGNITPLGEFYRDFQSTPSIAAATYSGSKLLAGLNNKITLSMQAGKTNLAEGESMTVAFTTQRPVGAPESFSIQLNLDEKQYVISQTTITIPEGGSTAQVTITAVDDKDIEELMNASITLTNLSTGIQWNNTAANFTITSDDVEVVTAIESELGSIQLYPNPTNRLIKVESPDRLINWTLTSLDGRVIDGITMNENTLDLQSVRAGVYFIKMTFDKGRVLNKRIVKY